jgi:putative nucleotidyltransferase with HDIG domain
MNSKSFVYALITAIVIAGLHHIFAAGRFAYPEYRLTEGQVSDMELISPFDFPILKSEEQLKIDRERALNKLQPPFSVSDQVRFDAFSSLDRIFATLRQHPNSADSEDLADELSKMKAPISPEFLALATNSDARERAYSTIYNAISAVYKTPIYDLASGDSLTLYEGDKPKKVSVEGFQEYGEAKSSFQNALSRSGYSAFAEQLSESLVNPNLIVDENKYQELKQIAINSVPTQEGEVLQNEIILRKGSRLSKSDLNKLSSLTEAYKARNMTRSPWQRMGLSMGMLFFVLLVLLITNSAFNLLVPERLAQDSMELPVNLSYIFTALFGVLSNYVLGVNNIIIPFAMIPLAIAILTGFEFGIFISIANALILNPFINWEAYAPVILLLATLITLVFVHRIKAWHEPFRIWLILSLSLIVVNLTLALYKNDPLIITLQNSGYALISSTVSVLGATAISSFYERRWNRSTKQTLLELLDFNHPLLKQLATQAVGTYHHSLVVGNLAERAAEAIGADARLTRVGSYYHDIGKLVNSDIFTENNEDSSSIHEKWDPKESAGMVRDHVQEGVALAHKYDIPKEVIDIIKEHHGTSRIRFFLDLAQRQGLDPDLEDFTYEGPKPRSKESALVMLADIVESTTKAKALSSKDELEKIIDDTIQRMIRDGQLNEAPITISDLHKAKIAMLPILESIYRKRLDYPDEQKPPSE